MEQKTADELLDLSRLVFINYWNAQKQSHQFFKDFS